MTMSGATPPSSEPGDLERFLVHLREHGVVFEIDAALRHDADQGGHPQAERRAQGVFAVPGLPPILEHRAQGIGSDHATWSTAADLARHELVKPGGTFWDIGTGTGLLALAAHELGAGHIVATDVSAEAVAAARRNFTEAGADVSLFTGSLMSAVPTSEPAPDLITANLPQKPRRSSDELSLAEDGGEDGDALLSPFFVQAASRMQPGAQLVFFQHSLPHPRNLAQLGEHFDLRLLSWKRRFLAPGEYGDLQNWFAERSKRGESYLAEVDGWRFLVACVWVATRR